MSSLRRILKAASLLERRGSLDHAAWGQLLTMPFWDDAGLSTHLFGDGRHFSSLSSSDVSRHFSSSPCTSSTSAFSSISSCSTINSTRAFTSSRLCSDAWTSPDGTPFRTTYSGEYASDEVEKPEDPDKPLPNYDPKKRYQPKNMQEMLEYLIIRKFITSQRTADVMSLVDRMDYAHAHYALAPDDCYYDVPVPIGRGQFASPPSVHAVTLQAVESLIQPGSRVLDVGSGCGYLLTCFGLLATREGLALGIERHSRLVDLASWNLVRCHLALIDGASMEAGGVVLHEGNALEDNVLDDLDLFDVIHVSASTPSVPQVLLDLLKPGGRMVIPIGKPLEAQVLTAIDKDKDTGELSTMPLGRVKVLPLTPAYADQQGW